MENKVSIWKNSINYGLIAGILGIALSLILWLLGMMENSWLSSIGYLILAFVMFIGAKNWRDNFNNGWMTYGEAFKTGFYIALISAVLGTLYLYVFLNFIDPGFIENILRQTEDSILESNPNISDEDFDRAMELTGTFTSSTMMTVMGLVMSIIFGAIIAAIVAIFAKKVNPADAV